MNCDYFIHMQCCSDELQQEIKLLGHPRFGRRGSSGSNSEFHRQGTVPVLSSSQTPGGQVRSPGSRKVWGGCPAEPRALIMKVNTHIWPRSQKSEGRIQDKVDIC